MAYVEWQGSSDNAVQNISFGGIDEGRKCVWEFACVAGQLEIFSTEPQPKKILIWIHESCESPEAYTGYQVKKLNIFMPFKSISRLSIHLSPKSGFYIYKYLLDTFSSLSNRHLTFHLLKTEIVIFLFPLDLILLTDSLFC